MHFRHHLPLLLLLAWGLVDVGVVVTFIVLDAIGSAQAVPWDPIFVGLVTVQGSMAAAWLYLSGEWVGLHAISLLVMILCVGACIPLTTTTVLHTAVYLVVLAMVNYPLAVLHDNGWRYRFHATSPEECKPWQFSLSDLMGLTLIVGVSLGLWMLLGRTVSGDVISKEPRFVLYAGLLAWLPAIRILVGIVRSPLMVAGWAAAGVIHLRLITKITLSRDWATDPYFWMIVDCGVILTLQAAALRWAGWRIERDPRKGQGADRALA